MSQPCFSTTRKVQFGDTDMAGIMHFSNFFKFMEVAETEFLQACGLSVTWQEGLERFGFPRVAVSCEYHSPARFEDELTIQIYLEKLGSKSISYRFEFSCQQHPIATGKITAVFCRTEHQGVMKSEIIPEALRQKILAPGVRDASLVTTKHPGDNF